MKNTMKKSLSFLLAVMIIAGTMLLSGCVKKDIIVIKDPLVIEDLPATEAPLATEDPLVTKNSDTYIVIKTTREAIGDKTDMLLIDYMAKLKEKGQLEFEIANGMITSINGIENPADYSSCWMLYTSDEELSNSAWGIVEYEGKEYGSAISGAETLPIKADRLYIWVFKSFS